MIPDLDIYRSARALVQQHGPDAPIPAAMRADELLEAGDLAGYTVWKRILRAVGDASVEGTTRRGYGSIVRKPASSSLDDRSSSNPPEKKSGAARVSHYRLRIFREKIAFWTSVAKPRLRSDLSRR